MERACFRNWWAILPRTGSQVDGPSDDKVTEGWSGGRLDGIQIFPPRWRMSRSFHFVIHSSESFCLSPHVSSLMSLGHPSLSPLPIQVENHTKNSHLFPKNDRWQIYKNDEILNQYMVNPESDLIDKIHFHAIALYHFYKYSMLTN